MKAPWLTVAGFPERVALIHMFTSSHWWNLAMHDDFHVSVDSIAKFHQRFPTESPLRGTNRTWLTKTVRHPPRRSSIGSATPKALPRSSPTETAHAASSRSAPAIASQRPSLPRPPREQNGYAVASEKLTRTATTPPDPSRSAETGK